MQMKGSLYFEMREANTANSSPSLKEQTCILIADVHFLGFENTKC